MPIFKPACFICDLQDCPYLPSHADLQMVELVTKKIKYTGGTYLSQKLRCRESSVLEHQSYFYDPCQRCDAAAARGTPDKPLCLNCQHRRIQHFFICTRSHSVHGLKLLLGTYQQIQEGYRDACEICTMIYKSLQVKRVMASYVWDDSDELKADSKAWLYRAMATKNERSRMSITWGQGHDLCELSLGLAASPTGPWYSAGLNGEQEQKTAMRAAGTKISWELVREWLSACDTQHHLEASNITQPIAPGHLPRGFMVIDVRAGCLIDAPPNCSYVALSYVWGVFYEGELSATMAAMPDLRLPGSLRRDTLPATIWDTFTVCLEIGVQYLWIDRLCIMQDSGSQKMEQIQSMDIIYSHAVLTICALGSSDSHSGLWGTAGTPRALLQGHARIGEADIIEKLNDDRVWRLGHAWWRRAWTYQEYLLSGPKLLFSPWNLMFECGHGVEVEGFANISNFTPESDIRGSRRSRLQKYDEIVQEYNDREFTYPDDIYDAFQGVFKLLYGSLDEFVWCLPAADFDKALVWSTESLHPWHNEFDEPCWRGTPRVPTRGVHLASWSWVSASGRTTLDSNLPGFFSSVARWYHWNNDKGLRPVVNDGLTWDQSEDSIIHAWAAWHVGCIETPMPEDIKDSSNFTYLQEKLSQKWPTYQDYWHEAFRVPAPEFTSEQLALVKEKTGRLLLRTSLASLQIEYEKSRQRLTIRDNCGKHVGLVQDKTTAPTFSERFYGKNYDFVAFSTASSTPPLDDLQEEGWLGQACDFKPLPQIEE